MSISDKAAHLHIVDVKMYAGKIDQIARKFQHHKSNPTPLQQDGVFERIFYVEPETISSSYLYYRFIGVDTLGDFDTV